MSDPVSQAEIEDVLSSIRRLVSDDGRSSGPAAPAAVQAEAGSRLVLTPALRVHDGGAGKPDVAAPETRNDAETAALPASDHGSEPEAEAEGEATVGASDPGGAHSDASVSLPLQAKQVEPTQDLQPTHPTEERPREHPSEVVGTDDTAPWRDPEATLYQVAAELGAEVPTDPALVADDAEDSLEESADSKRVSAVVQKIAELEAKVAQKADHWEPDGMSTDPYSGSSVETLEWQDHHEEEGLDDTPAAATSESLSIEAGSVAQEAATDEVMEQLASDESVLDEDSLRELVADIVRAELQGALGERITRNVRKLVRREIHRALTAQDLI